MYHLYDMMHEFALTRDASFSDVSLSSESEAAEAAELSPKSLKREKEYPSWEDEFWWESIRQCRTVPSRFSRPFGGALGSRDEDKAPPGCLRIPWIERAPLCQVPG